jgi:hypothetical protein
MAEAEVEAEGIGGRSLLDEWHPFQRSACLPILGLGSRTVHATSVFLVYSVCIDFAEPNCAYKTALLHGWRSRVSPTGLLCINMILSRSEHHCALFDVAARCEHRATSKLQRPYGSADRPRLCAAAYTMTNIQPVRALIPTSGTSGKDCRKQGGPILTQMQTVGRCQQVSIHYTQPTDYGRMAGEAWGGNIVYGQLCAHSDTERNQMKR